MCFKILIDVCFLLNCRFAFYHLPCTSRHFCRLQFYFNGFNNQVGAPSFTIDDGAQPPLVLASKDRNTIAATFSCFMLQRIGTPFLSPQFVMCLISNRDSSDLKQTQLGQFCLVCRTHILLIKPYPPPPLPTLPYPVICLVYPFYICYMSECCKLR